MDVTNDDYIRLLSALLPPVRRGQPAIRRLPVRHRH